MEGEVVGCEVRERGENEEIIESGEGRREK